MCSRQSSLDCGVQHLLLSVSGLSCFAVPSFFLLRQLAAATLVEHDIRGLSMTEAPLQTTEDSSSSSSSSSPSSLLVAAHANLPQIRDVYLKLLRELILSPKSLDHSR